MKRNWFSRHPIAFMALYLLLYLSAFNFLNTQIHMPHVLVHCRLDDLIPFCKYAVIPYFAWFPWIPFTLFFLLWKAPREDFWRLCLPLFGGMTLALACYVILPTGLNLRPYYVPGSDIFARAVRFLYRTDTPINVCPSIHVFNSVTLLLAYYRSRLFERPRLRWMPPSRPLPSTANCCRPAAYDPLRQDLRFCPLSLWESFFVLKRTAVFFSSRFMKKSSRKIHGFFWSSNHQKHFR